MRRSERQVNDPAEIRDILDNARLLFIAFHDEPAPLVLPQFFGHEQGRIYVHGAPRGARIDLLAARAEVGFAAVAEAQVVAGKAACDFTARARSVVGTARARIVDNEKEKRHGLDLMMNHYAGTGERFTYRVETLARTCVVALEIITIMGKRIGGPPPQSGGQALPTGT